MDLDYCVIGGGIVGLATAMALLERHPGARLTVLDKESSLARHQTGHNSGVIHSGIYYAPGSLKADLCRRGARATKAFCADHRLPFETCGKLLVATTDLELQRLEALAERAGRNGIEVERLTASALVAREPALTGLGGLLVPETGIVDYTKVCERMAEVITGCGGRIERGAAVTGIRETGPAVTILAGGRLHQTRQLIVCAGLQSDRLARMAQVPTDHRIVPFRGEYYRLPPAMNQLVRHLVYPVPDPALPFLGVHLTRMIDGSVTVGPNAVLGWAREGYPKFSFNARDVADFATFPGFWITMGRHLGHGLKEMRDSLWKRGYLEACRKYAPGLQLADLQPATAGIRAQAVMRDGRMAEDFLFLETPRMLHVCNAPSPAATSAIPIGAMIADKILERTSPKEPAP